MDKVGENVILYCGDCLEVLRELPSGSVHCCVTSPPYWGLRNYGTATWEGGDPGCDHVQSRNVHGGDRADRNQEGYKKKYSDRCLKCGAVCIDAQIGLELTPEQYVANLVAVFQEVKRVLRDDGTLWLNLGDSYAGGGGSSGHTSETENCGRKTEAYGAVATGGRVPFGLKPKDLVGIPWSVAKALQRPFYAGRIKSELDRVWLAATIDAEGSICGFTHKRKDDGTIRTGIHLTITNTNGPLLDNAFRIWPTSRKNHNFHGEGHLGSADTYRWIAHNVDGKSELLREIYPYLIAKKKQALLAWNFLEMSRDAKRLARTCEAETVKEKRAWIVAALSRLNHFGEVDIPSWVIEPPSLYEPGFYLRQDIVWEKPNPMPESVTDRCTKAHEYIFLLTKTGRYYYDAEAIKEDSVDPESHKGRRKRNADRFVGQAFSETRSGFSRLDGQMYPKRNRRSVWTVTTKPYSEAHFATFPPDLILPCILAGTSEFGCCPKCGKPWIRVVEKTKTFESGSGRSGNQITGKQDLSASETNSTPDIRMGPSIETKTIGWRPGCECGEDPVPCVVLDPFNGSGTTGEVSVEHGRKYVGIDLNPEYIEMSKKRIRPVVKKKQMLAFVLDQAETPRFGFQEEETDDDETY